MKQIEEIRVIDPFVSHSSKDIIRIMPILNYLCCCGIRPWKDKTELTGLLGQNLRKKIREKIQSKDPVCILLFLTINTVESDWVKEEMQWWVEIQESGARLIPIYLENIEIKQDSPIYPLLYPGGRKDRYYIRSSDPNLYLNLVASIFNHYKIDEIKEIVFHSGHRLPWKRIEIPLKWKNDPLLDFRTMIGDGNKDYSPKEEKWEVLISALRIVKQCLPKLNTIKLCGYGPIGFACSLTDAWGRSSNVALQSYNPFTDSYWVSKYKPSDWPLDTPLFEIINEKGEGFSKIESVFIGNRKDIYNDVREFLEKKNIIWLRTPIKIEKNVDKLVNQIIGYILWLLISSKKVNIFFAIPFGLAGLIAWNLSSTPVILYDNYKSHKSKYLKVLEIK